VYFITSVLAPQLVGDRFLFFFAYPGSFVQPISPPGATLYQPPMCPVASAGVMAVGMAMPPSNSVKQPVCNFAFLEGEGFERMESGVCGGGGVGGIGRGVIGGAGWEVVTRQYKMENQARKSQSFFDEGTDRQHGRGSARTRDIRTRDDHDPTGLIFVEMMSVNDVNMRRMPLEWLMIPLMNCCAQGPMRSSQVSGELL